MGLVTKSDNISVCKACIKNANSLKDPTLPPLFSEINGLNLGPVPGFLPILTAVEELLIARIYIHLQVVHVCGQQHCYTGHICCFGQNTPKTWNQLPQLPTELNILVVRPVAVKGNKYLSQQFTKWYIIKCSAIALWLYFLKVNHPNYHNVEICSTWLTSLPKNGSILYQLPHIDKPESDSSGLTAQLIFKSQSALASTGNSAPVQHPPTVDPLPVKLSNDILDAEFDDNILDTLVPNLVPNLNELELLNRKVQHQQGL